MDNLTIDDIGKPVHLNSDLHNVHGVLGAVSDRDRTCLVRLPNSGLVIGWLPWANVTILEKPAEAAA